MSDELLFGLRVLASVLLYLFVGVAFYLLWRDYRAEAIASAARTRPLGRLLVVQTDDDAGPVQDSFPLFPLTTIGRAPTNTVVLPDSFASNEHAVLTLRGKRWWLQDQDSANGTTLNGHLVKEPTVLSSGDIIGVGRVRLRLKLD